MNNILSTIKAKLDSRRRTLSFHNKYVGKRCFIIGNGPSLNKTNLSILKKEITFGQNRIYLNFKKMGYSTTFLVCINPLVVTQFSDDLVSSKGPIKFLTSKAIRDIGYKKDIIYLDSIDDVGFSKSIEKGLWEGATVTYISLQLAYYMGFSEVILVGVDHHFVTKGISHSTVSMTEDDPNHFSPKYFKGVKWQLPDLETSELAYKIAKTQYEYDGRKVIDATVNGKLKVFPKIKLEKLL